MKIRKVRNRDGSATIKIKPDPRYRKITFGVFEAACKTLDLDPDAIFHRGFAMTEMLPPPPSKARAFLHVVLTNARSYRLDDLDLDVYSLFMAGVAGQFFFLCQTSIYEWGRVSSTFMIGTR